MTVRLAWLEEVTICGFWRTRTLWVIHFGLCLSLIRNSYISSNILFHFPFRIKAYFDIDIWRYLIFFSFLQNEWRKNWNWFWFWKVYFPILLKCLFVCFVFKYSCDQKGKGIIPVGHTSYIKSACEYASLAWARSSPHLI